MSIGLHNPELQDEGKRKGNQEWRINVTDHTSTSLFLQMTCRSCRFPLRSCWPESCLGRLLYLGRSRLRRTSNLTAKATSSTFRPEVPRRHTLTWAFVITCSYSSEGGVPVFAWEWSGGGQLISRSLFLVQLTERKIKKHRSAEQKEICRSSIKIHICLNCTTRQAQRKISPNYGG